MRFRLSNCELNFVLNSESLLEIKFARRITLSNFLIKYESFSCGGFGII